MKSVPLSFCMMGRRWWGGGSESGEGFKALTADCGCRVKCARAVCAFSVWMWWFGASRGGCVPDDGVTGPAAAECREEDGGRRGVVGGSFILIFPLSSSSSK